MPSLDDTTRTRRARGTAAGTGTGHGGGEASVRHGTWEPAPATRWEDAFLAGNGRHGALVFGDPEDDRVIVTHHSLVRPNNPPGTTAPPRLAAALSALQDALLAGDRWAADGFTDGRQLRWVRPFHPGFLTRIRRAPAAPALPVHRSVDFTTGVVSCRSGERRAEVFVSRADDVIVQYVTSPAPSSRSSSTTGSPASPPTSGRAAASPPPAGSPSSRCGPATPAAPSATPA